MEGIFFEQQGSGHPVILIHGFPINHLIWNDFAAKLASDVTVYTPDLPGFGQSKILPTPFSIDDVAEKLLRWIGKKQIKRSVLIGHSLGGYIALSMVEKRPDLFAGLGLFHSTALADSPEKKESRTKVMEFVEKNGALAFTSNFIQPLFANPAHLSITKVREIATQTSAEVVVGYTQAMRDRPNREHVLKTFSKPILFISGEKDMGLPVETIKQQALLCQYPDLHILNNVGHMGMMEQPEEVKEIIKAFVVRCNDLPHHNPLHF